MRTLNVNAPNADPTNGIENTEDAERVLGTAPGAGIDFVLIDTGSNDYFNMISFNTYKLRDPVITMSVGFCEAGVDPSYELQFDSLFQTSAMERITTLVAAGDKGAACDFPAGRLPNGEQVRSINALCASSYVTCAGGTTFTDMSNPSQYWSANNGPGLESALSYIPEGTWNGTQTRANSYLVESGGGGISKNIAKPAWQVGRGVLSALRVLFPISAFLPQITSAVMKGVALLPMAPMVRAEPLPPLRLWLALLLC